MRSKNLPGEKDLDEQEADGMKARQRLFFRDMFREARAGALRDAEGFRGLVHAVERLGAFRTRTIANLRDYRQSILALLEVSSTSATQPTNDWSSARPGCADWSQVAEDETLTLY